MATCPAFVNDLVILQISTVSFISDSPWSYLGYCIATDALGESYQLKPVRSNPGLAMKAHPDARPVSPVFC